MRVIGAVSEQRASVGSTVAAVVMTALGVFWVVKVLPGLWTADIPNRVTHLFRYDPVPMWWLWGDSLWHAYSRTIPFLGAGTALWGPLLLVDYFGPARIRESFIFGAFLVVSVLGTMLGAASIALLNQPWFWVPRPLRDRPGLFVELWRRARSR